MNTRPDIDARFNKLTSEGQDEPDKSEVEERSNPRSPDSSFGSMVDAAQHFAASQFGDLSYFFFKMEEFVRESETADVEAIQESAVKKGIETGPGFWTENLPYVWEQVFDFHLRTAAVVSACSLFEYHLTIAHNLTRHGFSLAKTASDFRKKSKINRYMRFFQRAAGLTSPSAGDWTRIDFSFDVRQAIVHNGGSIDEVFGIELEDDKSNVCDVVSPTQRSRIKDYVKTTNGIWIDQQGFINVGAEYCGDLVEVMSGFFRLLYDGIRDRASELCREARG